MKRVYFKELFDVSSGLSKGAKELANGDSPFLSFKTIFNNTFIPDVITDTANTNESEQKKYSVQKGDVFLTRTSETTNELGMSSVALKDYPNAVFNGFSKRLRLKPENSTSIDLKFLGYFLRSRIFRDQVDAMSNTSTRASLNIEMINRLYLVLPDLITQERIGNTLYLIDNKIKNNNEINQNLEEQAKAIFKSWFIDYGHWNGQIPSDWVETSLGKICSCELGGTPSRANKDYWNGTIPWINSGEVNKFRITKPSENITELGLSKSATKLLPAKTTVIAITGATLGQVSLLEIDSCANQSVVGVIPNETLPYEFIYPMITAKIQELISHQTGGAQQHINKQNVEQLSFMMPTREVISAYTDLVNSLYARIATNCFENESLVELRDSLLPRLMSGEIDVSEIDL